MLNTLDEVADIVIGNDKPEDFVSDGYLPSNLPGLLAQIQNVGVGADVHRETIQLLDRVIDNVMSLKAQINLLYNAKK
jgi:hypothetical protein